MKTSAIKNLLFLTLLILLGGRTSGQDENKFNGEIADFPKELNDLIDPQSDTDKAFLKQLEQFWASDSINLDKKENIVELAGYILPLQKKNKEALLRYIKVIAHFFRDGYAMQQYETWNKAANATFKSEDFSLIILINFLNTTENAIFSSFLNVTNSFTWKSNIHPSYNLKYDKELSIIYNNINLICISRDDSVFIKNTSGTYYPNTKKWIGKGGKITWIRSEFPENEIFIDINHRYGIDISKNTFSIDSVMFTNKDYFTSPNMGSVTDKLVKDYTKNNIQYPEFQSYDKWFQIENLFKNVNYEGGFTMKGSQLIGTGTNDKLATIIIDRDGKEFLRAEGEILVFQRTILNSDKASVKIRFGADSLFHTGLSFNYNNKTRIVTIAPTDKLTTQSPIHSSYHKLSIWFNQLTWNIDSDNMKFSAPIGSSTGIAQFESDDYFNEEVFDAMMGPNDRHPLFAIWTYTKNIKDINFLAADFAVYLRKPVEQVKIEMMRIAKQGYIMYNFATDEVTVADKLFNAIQARHQKIDYDVIKFNSRCEGKTPNAVLNIDSLNLKINGIDLIEVSQTQNVNISPRNNSIEMGKNRNFKFSGNMEAGLLNFYGDNFNFNYGEFTIYLKDVDIVELDYQSQGFDAEGKRLVEKVTSTLEKITGNVLIDKPNNKSGLKKNPQYPIFNSTKYSYVYYDAPNIYNGIYKRDSIYFKIFPFSYKNLNNFEKEDMIFRGMFYSKNILAPIEDSLVLRPDNSLGFVHRIPDEGFAVYQGKGRAYNVVDVSDQGIMVNGKITYITSTTTSQQLLLFPDSMITQSDKFTIDKQLAGIEFPNVTALSHKIKWYPKKDVLNAYKGAEPFSMFETQAMLVGNLQLKPTGLSGSGSITLPSAKMHAQLYEFNADNYSSPTLNLTLLNPETKEDAFTSDNIKSYIDFASQSGTFEKNDKSIFANLVPLKYEAHLDRFSWDMADNELTLLTPKKQKYIEESPFYRTKMHPSDSSLKGSLFYSVMYNEDSLNFISSKATYNTKTANLKAENVQRIIAADAMVIPSEQKVQVSPKERMHLLKNAVVNANTDSLYHRFYNAEIAITGRKMYGGEGLYDYVDELDSIQTIHFSKIMVDSALNTYAETNVTEPDSFTLSPNFGYFGKIRAYAPDRFLTFNGYTKPFYSCCGTKAEWFNFKAQINPDNILIPIEDKVRSQNLAFLTNGSVVREDTIKLYGGFFQKRYDYADMPMVATSGYLSFNNKNRRFTIAPLHKLQNPDTTGNAVSLQKDYCYLFSEGLLNIPANLGQVKFTSYGSIIHKLEAKDISINLVSKMDFFFNQPALDLIANDINQMVSLPKVDLTKKIYRKALAEFVDKEQLPNIINKLNLFGTIPETPAGLESTITFADINLTWDPVRKSFISKGKIGIGSIGKIQVNKYVDGYLEIFKRRSGDVFNLYIQIGSDKYYGFVYTKSTLQVVSSNNNFLSVLNLLKSKDTKLKTRPGQPAYKFLVGTKKEQDIVKKRYDELISGVSSTPDKTEDSEDPQKAENEDKE